MTRIAKNPLHDLNFNPIYDLTFTPFIILPLPGGYRQMRGRTASHSEGKRYPTLPEIISPGNNNNDNINNDNNKPYAVKENKFFVEI